MIIKLLELIQPQTQLEEIAYLDNLEDAAYQATIDELNSDITD